MTGDRAVVKDDSPSITRLLTQCNPLIMIGIHTARKAVSGGALAAPILWSDGRMPWR
jgi:hypothetical protein